MSAGLINDRGAGDPNFIGNVTAFACVSARNCRDARLEEADFPKRSAAQSIGIEGVDAVVLRRDIDYVVEALSGNVHVGDVERRGI